MQSLKPEPSPNQTEVIEAVEVPQSLAFVPECPNGQMFFQFNAYEEKNDITEEKELRNRLGVWTENSQNLEKQSDEAEFEAFCGLDSGWDGFGQALIEKPEELLHVALALEDCPALALDTETFNLRDPELATDPFKEGSGLRLLSIAGEVEGTQRVFVIDLLKTGHDLGRLKELLESKELIIFNAGFDLPWLARFCGVRPRKVFDCSIAEHLLRNGRSDSFNEIKTKDGIVLRKKAGFYGLQAVLKRWFGLTLDKTEQAGDWSKCVLTADQINYASNDVKFLLDLAEKQRAELEASGLGKIARLEMELIPVTASMREHGIEIDTASNQRRIAELEASLNRVWSEALEQFKKNGIQERFKFTQRKVLLSALNRLGIQPFYKGEPSTDKRAIASELKKPNVHPILKLIAECRGIEGEIRQARQIVEWTDTDGRLRTTYDPTGTTTGRFSSHRPNLQNIKKDGQLRAYFTASGPDRVLLVGDYCSMEMVGAGIIAGEKILLDDLKAGGDIHRKTAGRVFGKPEGEVTDKERALGKLCNFGLLYGGGVNVLLENSSGLTDMNLSFESLTRLKNAWLSAFPLFKAWHDREKALFWDDTSKVEKRSLWGRRRLDIRQPRESLNMVVQGSCADVLKLAMVRFWEATQGKDIHLVGTTHDELAVDCPESLARETKTLLGQIMKQSFWDVFGPDAPIAVEIGWGRNWKEAKGKDACK